MTQTEIFALGQELNEEVMLAMAPDDDTVKKSENEGNSSEEDKSGEASPKPPKPPIKP
jgi:hypothetical protein